MKPNPDSQEQQTPETAPEHLPEENQEEMQTGEQTPWKAEVKENTISTLWILTITLAVFLLSSVAYMDTRDAMVMNHANINPEAEKAVHEIALGCERGEGNAETLKCFQLNGNPLCNAVSDKNKCTLEEQYEALEKIGFDLPPLYKEGYTPRVPFLRKIFG